MRWRGTIGVAALVGIVLLCGGTGTKNSLVSAAWAGDLATAIDRYRRGDYATAYADFQNLAAAGNPDAAFWIGSMWHHGRGRPQSYREALTWYQRAAYRGSADAQNNIGLMHRDGAGVMASPMVAYAWFALAAGQNSEVGRRNLQALIDDRRLTPEQVIEGQQLAEDYLSRIEDHRRRVLTAGPPVVAVAAAPVPVPAPDPVRAADPAPAVATGRGPVSLLPRATPIAAPVVPEPARAPVATPVASPVVPAAVAGPGQPGSRRAIGPATLGGQSAFLVQVGLFRNAENVARIKQGLAARGMAPADDVVTIRGEAFRRLRLGPFVSADKAAATAQVVNGLFNLTSAVVPVLQE